MGQHSAQGHNSLVPEELKLPFTVQRPFQIGLVFVQPPGENRSKLILWPSHCLARSSERINWSHPLQCPDLQVSCEEFKNNELKLAIYAGSSCLCYGDNSLPNLKEKARCAHVPGLVAERMLLQLRSTEGFLLLIVHEIVHTISSVPMNNVHSVSQHFFMLPEASMPTGVSFLPLLSAQGSRLQQNVSTYTMLLWELPCVCFPGVPVSATPPSM